MRKVGPHAWGAPMFLEIAPLHVKLNAYMYPLSKNQGLPPPNKLFFVRSSAADSAWRTSSPLLCWSNENIMKETGGKVLQKKIPLLVIFIIKYSPKQYEAKSKSAMIKHFHVRMVHQTIS